MTTKFTSIVLLLALVSGLSFGQTGVVNNGAKIIVTTGAYLNIDGGTNADYTNQTANSTNGSMDLDGVVKIEGDWVNNATSGNVLINPGTNGDIQFDGTTTQNIDGTTNDYYAFEKLTVASGATLQIAENEDVTLNGSFTNNGTFKVLSSATGSASLIDNGTIAGTADETVQIYLTGSNSGSAPNGQWWYVSPPISDGTAAFIFTPTTYRQLYYWNETATGTHGWNEITGSSTALNAMQGYASRTDANLSLEFTGSLNTSTKSIALSRTTGQTYEGFNLVGNPYPSAIDWEASSGWTKTNVQNNSMWFRSNGTYPSYNGNTHIGTLSATRYIPSMQGFWVRVASGQSSGTLGVNNNVRVHSSQAFWKEDRSFPRLRLTVNRENMIDEAVIAFIPGADDEFDMYDTEKFFATNPDVPQIYMNVPENKYLTVDALPELNKDIVVPLYFKTEQEGQFSITASDYQEISSLVKIFLEDIQLGKLVNLRQSGYEFSSSEYNDERFAIHFVMLDTPDEDLTDDDGIATGVDALKNQFIDIYSFESNIYVKCNNPDDLNAQVSIINLLGQEVLHKELENTTLNRINYNGLPGNYLVRVYSNQFQITKKVFLK